MSGFLSRLIGRTRETAEVVRPRVASLFEPGEAARQVDAGVESVEIDRPVETFASREPSVSVQGDRREEAAPNVTVRQKFVEPDEEKTQRVAWVGREVKPVVEPRIVAGSEPRLEVSERKPLIRARLQASESERRQEREAVSEIGETTERRVVPAESHETERHVKLVREERVSLLPVQSVFTRMEAPSLVLPPRRPQFEAAAPPVASVAASEPVVEVTIGRIEVRAVAEGKTKAKANPAVMGLDEYLKTRGRGGRP